MKWKKKIHAKEKYGKLDSEVYLSIRSNSTGALTISIDPLNAKDKNKTDENGMRCLRSINHEQHVFF